MTDAANAQGRRLRIAVLASGSGTTLQAVIDACQSGAIDGDVVLVISNNSNSGAIERARRHGIETVHLSGNTHSDPEVLDWAVTAALDACAPDIVLLAGYMKKLGSHVLEAYRGRVINTHPSLLPKHGGQGMYGGHVHAAVIASGEDESGVSVHLVDADYDTGAVIAQRSVPVEADDDAEALAARVQVAEKPFLIEVLQGIAKGGFKLSSE